MSDVFALVLIILVNVLIYGLAIWGIIRMIYKRAKHPAHTLMFLSMIFCVVIFTASMIQKIMYYDWTINLATLAPMMGVFSIYMVSRRENRVECK
ncbi:hypothetical protein PQ460_19435 [Paenibacillus sp. KACC 21273]|uniref:hypothetical protein n=1 Tax=Paenibacillus sp. KACC 21273 TaxID=3025665 RepID=UPI002366DD25|nr:hypothetical protein [Paenibacillus sp. KACC 21273]WDF50137.1 hypothetical protein PQ460_19435 [Paenibacillus sp. KACC 21273]